MITFNEWVNEKNINEEGIKVSAPKNAYTISSMKINSLKKDIDKKYIKDIDSFISILEEILINVYKQIEYKNNIIDLKNKNINNPSITELDKKLIKIDKLVREKKIQFSKIKDDIYKKYNLYNTLYVLDENIRILSTILYEAEKEYNTKMKNIYKQEKSFDFK